MPSAYVDPWDIMNDFCFHVYSRKLICIYIRKLFKTQGALNKTKCAKYLNFTRRAAAVRELIEGTCANELFSSLRVMLCYSLQYASYSH